MSAAKHTPTLAAMPLHFDGDTNNLINAEGVALARFRHFSQGEAVARLCNSHDALVAALEKAEAIVAANTTKRLHGSRDGADPELPALLIMRAALKAAKGEA